MTEVTADNKEIDNIVQQPNAEVTQESSPSIKSEENKENWKRFREEKDKERKARIEAEKESQRRKEEAEALKAALEAVVNKPNQYQNQPSNDYYNEETEEQRIEKLVKAQLDRERQKMREEQVKKDQEEVPQRLNSEYKDFNKIVNEESVDYLEYHHPEIAIAFKHMPDSYEKWASVYQAVKKLVPNMANKEQDVKKIENNLKKPQGNPPNITDQKPETVGWKLTEQKRMENWRRMQEDARSF